MIRVRCINCSYNNIAKGIRLLANIARKYFTQELLKAASPLGIQPRGYNLDIIGQSACLVANPITVYSYGFLLNCTTVNQASDSMTAPT